MVPVSYPPNSSPGAADESWTTPAVPPGPVVTPAPMSHEVPETPDPIVSPGPRDAKSDDVSASVAGAMAAAEARYRSHEADTRPQGSVIGTLMDLPEVPGQHSKHVGGDDDGYPA